MTSNAAVRMSGVDKSFRKVRAVHQLSLTIERGVLAMIAYRRSARTR